MRLLLDSHVFLWAVSVPFRLSPRARTELSSAANETWVSHASIWELTIKSSLGRLTTAHPPVEMAERSLMRLLPIELHH